MRRTEEIAARFVKKLDLKPIILVACRRPPRTRRTAC